MKGLYEKLVTPVRLMKLSINIGRLTRHRTVSTWLSPSRIAAHGWLTWRGSKDHILTVQSSDAEAMIYGLMGDTARSLIS